MLVDDIIEEEPISHGFAILYLIEREVPEMQCALAPLPLLIRLGKDRYVEFIFSII
jgi:hypothetical protein